MGYEVARFVGEVEEEFHCQICNKILENPLESPCEHIFCSECIKCWLSSNNKCPVDFRSLEYAELKRPARIIRNILDKLPIRCDFQQEGCKEIVQLEHLKYHILRCEQNPSKPSKPL